MHGEIVMAMPVNSKTYNRMIEEDIAWLKEQGVDIDASENWLYGKHIKEALEFAKTHYKENVLPNLPESARDC